MPQLDLISFFNQFIWFMLFFFIFYFLFLNNIIFYFGSCLKIRNKKLIAAWDFTKTFNLDSSFFSENYNTFLKESSKISIISLGIAFTSLNFEIQKAKTFNLNKNKKNSNQKFLTNFSNSTALFSNINKYFLIFLEK